jgi:hypothetical protein
VVFVATTANADWTTLPAKPAYVALMQELLAGSMNPGDAWMNLTVGEPMVVPPTVKLLTTPTLIDPQSRSIAVEQATDSAGVVSYRSGPLGVPGVYTFKTGAENVPIAVNVPADAADVRSIDDPAIKSALGDIDITMDGDQLPAAAETANAGNDMGWNVMVIVLALVALECFLAMRFGHFKRK